MYTDEEICLMFKNADERQDRVKLLSELSSLSKKEVVKILNKYGITVESKKEKRKQLKEKSCELYEQGNTQAKIAGILGISVGVVQYWVSNINTTYKNSKVSDDEFLTYYNQGLNDNQIAKKVGCGPTTIFRIRNRKKLGVNKKPTKCKLVSRFKNLGTE